MGIRRRRERERKTAERKPLRNIYMWGYHCKQIISKW